MVKPIAIVAGEPNSISSEIIFKTWKLRKKFRHKPILIIGNVNLLKAQNKKLKYTTRIKELDNNFKIDDLNTNHLPVYNVKYFQKKPFKKISNKSNDYIFKCFNIATNLIKTKKICGFINCPVAKETLLNKKYKGITEFLAKKVGKTGDEVMLIFNKKLSVATLTTHIPLSQVSKKISKSKIIKSIKTINNFYEKNFSKKPKFAILGLNPHNFSAIKKSEERKIIYPAIKIIRKRGIKVSGPISPDTSFMLFKEKKFDIIFGMYHDQVLTPFKALFKYDAINITLGLPFIRISPDHGVAENIAGKKVANPKSLVESVKFFNYIK